MSKHDPNKIQELVERCLRGDQSAWSELIDIITPVVLGVCKSMRLTRDETLDIYGQTCYLILTNLEKLRSPDKLLSYVSTTVRREAMRVMIRARFFEDARQQQLIEIEPAASDQPDHKIETEETSELVLAALLLIPPEDAHLLRLLFLDESDPSYEEISRQLGIPVSSIGPKRKRALEKLLVAVKRLGFDF